MDYYSQPDIQQALERLLACQKTLQEKGSNIVWEILKDCQPFTEWEHCPKKDIYDKTTHSQYYYHAHASHDPDRIKEHGHFHLFLRTPAFEQAQPVAYSKKYVDSQGKRDNLCHLFAIAMNEYGIPKALFTTNHWVVQGVWYKAKDIIPVLDKFSITLNSPFGSTNEWISLINKIFKPAIADLLEQRDRVIQDWQNMHSDKNALEDKRLEVTSIAHL